MVARRQQACFLIFAAMFHVVLVHQGQQVVFGNTWHGVFAHEIDRIRTYRHRVFDDCDLVHRLNGARHFHRCFGVLHLDAAMLQRQHWQQVDAVQTHCRTTSASLVQ